MADVAARMDPAAFKQNLMADIVQQFNTLQAQGAMGNAQPLQPIYPAGVQPQAAPQSYPYQAATSPAIPQPPYQAPAAPQGEPVGQPFEQLIHGKYKTMQDADRGVSNLLQYASALADRNRTLETQFQQMQAPAYPMPPTLTTPLVPGSSPGALSRVNPAARTPLQPVDWAASGAVKQVADAYGMEPGPLADLARTIQEQTIAATQQAVQAELAPLYAQTQAQYAQAQAEAAMRQRSPDAFKYAQEMNIFMQADPVVKSTFDSLAGIGNYLGAMEYVWSTFRNHVAVAAQQNLQSQALDADAIRLAQRAQAGMSPSQPGTPSHAIDPNARGLDPQVLEDLSARARAGDHTAKQQYIAATFGEALKRDPLFNVTFGQRQ
jgi:hypothetical protein